MSSTTNTDHRLMRLSALFFLVSACLTTANTYAQDVKVNARIDSSSILIGEQIQLELSATFNPQHYKVQFPAVMDTFNHFEVVAKGKTDTLNGRNENIYTQRYVITSFDSGAWKIPSMAFDVLPMQGGEPLVVWTDSLLVNVQTVPVDTAKPFKPIFGIRSAKLPVGQIILYAVLIALGLLLLGFLTWYFLKKRKKKPAVQPEPEVVLLPHEKALLALEKLQEAELWQSGQDKAYHTQLTDIIRLYLEEQFNMDCFEKTSNEIIQQVKKVKALSTSRQLLRDIFETADIVKFAKGHPTPEEHIQSLQYAKEVIRESYKKVKPISANNESTP